MMSEQTTTQPPPCHACGMEACKACQGCHDVFYCSKKCQKWDWKKGGHRALCKGPATNRKMQRILLELLRSEFAWLETIDLETKYELVYKRDEDVDYDKFDEYPLCHLSRAGEVALVLARANACCILRHCGKKYYTNVLKPWYNKHKTFLNREGFVISYISKPVHLSDKICNCPERNGGPCGKHIDYGNGALVKDTKSPMIHTINKIFVERNMTEVTWKDFNTCVAFPPTVQVDSFQNSSVAILFDAPNHIFRNPEVCCAPCVESLPFMVHPDDAQALGEYFGKCLNAMAKIGLPISLKFKHLENWTDYAVATAWAAAADGSLKTFETWLQKDLAFCCEQERYDEIVETAYDMVD